MNSNGKKETSVLTFDNLPYDAVRNILLRVRNITDIDNFCGVNDVALHICSQNSFWKDKIDVDFPNASNVESLKEYLDTEKWRDVWMYLNVKYIRLKFKLLALEDDGLDFRFYQRKYSSKDEKVLAESIENINSIVFARILVESDKYELVYIEANIDVSNSILTITPGIVHEYSPSWKDDVSSEELGKLIAKHYNAYVRSDNLYLSRRRRNYRDPQNQNFAYTETVTIYPYIEYIDPE